MNRKDRLAAAHRVLRDNLQWRIKEDDPDPDTVIVASGLINDQKYILELTQAIVELTSYFIDNPNWIIACEKARTLIRNKDD